MPIETIEKDVDGRKIKIVQFAALRGQKLQTRLLKLVVPVLSPIIGSASNPGGKKSLLDANIDLAKVLPEAFRTLAEVVDEEKLQELILDLLAGTFIDNVVVDRKSFDAIFIANYTFMYKVVFEAVMANHFFDLGDIGNKLTQSLNQVSPQS